MPALESVPGKIGPYRLLEKIGEGGMGVVYLARDEQHRAAAVKVLGPLVADDPDARRRLTREVETMRRVRSPYVAEVLDADVTGPAPYIATQYVPGRTLADVVRADGPLRGAALDRFATGLASALSAIHAAGVVHRDLKPGNVMLEDGHPVVIDFGIANAADTVNRITQTGMVMGTPGYLAPEVIEGQKSTGASDVHSWGATVAFAATGREPFGGGSFQTIFFRVLQGKAELSGVPERLLPLVSAALSVDPAARPAAHALAQGCGALSGGGPMGGGAAGGGAAEGGAAGAGLPDGKTLPDSETLPDGESPDGARMGATRVDGRRQGPADRLPPYADPHAGWQHGRGPDRIPPSPATAAAGVADLLPPVQGRRPQRMDRQALSADRAAQREAQAATVPRAAYAWVALALGVMGISLSILLPVAGTVLVLVVLTLLRATDQAQVGLSARRSVYGARPSDMVLVIVSAPLSVVRAVLAAVGQAPIAVALAVGAAIASILFLRTDTLPEAGGWAAGAAMAWYCLGPGSHRPRRQLRRILHGTIRSRTVMTVALISGSALALAVVLSAVSQPPLTWPATNWVLPGMPSLGNALHATQSWLLRSTMGMLYLP